MKTGLVLEGGGTRAMYTAGVLDVFMEHDIRFDGMIGVSAGAIYGTNYVSGQKGRSIRYYKRFCRDKRLMSFRSLITTGNFVNKEFSYYTLPNELDVFDYEAFKANPMECYMVCTNVETGEAEYIRITDLKEEMEYLRASSSLPFMSRTVEINGRKYLDGGISDSIPVKKFKEMGFDRIVVVQTRMADYRKEPSKISKFSWIYRRYPKLTMALNRRSDAYNLTVEHILDMERKGEVLCIRPSRDLKVKRLEKDAEKLQAQYDLGRADALMTIENVKAYIAG